ncbi:MAG: FKBP-type peptidyl-prolyl cis-trans isomerase [Acidobacteriota bacterium]
MNEARVRRVARERHQSTFSQCVSFHCVGVMALAALTMAAAATAQDGRPVPDDLASPPPDAIVNPSGLASKVLVPGTGETYADANDMVAVHYVGWTPAGYEFQNSYSAEQPATFSLEKVFPGWTEAMQMMVTGEERRFWIPARLGPPNPKSGPRGDSIFDVKMIAIRQIPNPPAQRVKAPEDAERTLSGAYTRQLEAGAGEEYPPTDAAVLLHYTGWTADGKTFDSSLFRGRPTAFPLGKVMEPFADAVRLMVEGETRQVWIPGHLNTGEWPGSPRGPLVFEIQLLNILPEGTLKSGPIDKSKVQASPGATG